MALLPKDQVLQLRKAIAEHDFLHRIQRKIESTLRVVFHAYEVDWQYLRAAAEEILIADIMTRHHGQIDGVYYALRKREEGGHTWDQAIADYASYCHNYYTTPLGIVIRNDYFGDDAHFISPAAGKLSILYKIAEQKAPGTGSEVLTQVASGATTTKDRAAAVP